MFWALPDFKPTFELLKRYNQEYLGLSQRQKLLITEAIQRFRDLELLASRIYLRCKRLLEAVTADPEGDPVSFDVLGALKEASKSNPALAKWLADNPSLQGVEKISEGYASGAPEDLIAFETTDQQELRLDTELFYYLANRFCDCLQSLPSLTKFDCREIRIIRNNLIEHPQKKAHGDVLLASFAYNRDVGPIIKGTRYSSQSHIHPDAGFLPNCTTLLRVTMTALKAALSR